MSSDLNVSKKKTKPLFLAGVLSERKALFSLTILVRVVIQNFLKKPVISTVFKADE